MTSGVPARAANSNAAIVIDEIGISSGVVRDYRLKTLYRPIFRRTGNAALQAFAVEGGFEPFLEGQPVRHQLFIDEQGGLESSDIAALARELSLRNLPHAGEDDLQLVIDAVLPTAAGSIAATAFADDEGAEVDASRVIWGVSTSWPLDRHDLVEYALDLRAAGFGVAIGGFGTGPWDVACMQAVRPDIVRLDGAWFRRAASSASRLLLPLFAGLHDHGAEVLVDGIVTATELRVALECGADFLQGDLLGRPALAGVGVDTRPIAIGDFLRDERKVVPLFA
jgi:EAL domain-containing protein (putative c-di-GMP-specific phosphodiesterase class I)